MTCAECLKQIDAWLAGTLSEADAKALEAHAAECTSCGERLEAVSRVGGLPLELTPPSELRALTLAAVKHRDSTGQAETLNVVMRHKAARKWTSRLFGAGGIAAAVLVLMVSRPHIKRASDFRGANIELLARGLARPELAELDAAEKDLVDAMREHPEDGALATDLQRVRSQRDALQQLVQTASK